MFFYFVQKQINAWIFLSLTSPCAMFWHEQEYGRYPSQFEKEMLQNKKWYDFVIWMENEVSIVVLICHFSFFVVSCLLMRSLSSFVIPLVIAINMDKRTWDAPCPIHPQLIY